MNDHELTVLVETAASGASNSRVAIHGGVLWEALDPVTKNNYREAALPFIFHGAKALAELGYGKPRIVTTAEELDALEQRATILDAEGHVWTNDGDSLDQWGSVTHPESYGGPKWVNSAVIELPATVLHEGIR